MFYADFQLHGGLMSLNPLLFRVSCVKFLILCIIIMDLLLELIAYVFLDTITQIESLSYFSVFPKIPRNSN